MSAAGGGGGGGTPLKILFQILGISEAKSAISSLAPEVNKLSAAADAASKKVGAVVTPLEKTGAAGAKLTPASTGMDKIKTTSDSAAKSVTTVGGSMDKTRSSSDNVTSSVQKFSAESGKAKTTTDNLSGSLDKTAGSSQKSSQGLTEVASSSGKVSSETTKTTGSVDKLGSSHDKLNTTTKNVSSGLQQESGSLQTVSTGHDKAATSADKNTASTTSLRSAFSSSMGAAASLGGGITSLWQTYDSLGDAQLRVDKATNQLHATDIKIQSLQTQLNKLVAEGKEGTDQYSIVEQKLQLAQDKRVATEGTLQNAQEDLNITQAEFYQRIIPETISVLGSMTTLLSNSGGLLTKFKEGLSSLSIESLKTSKVLSLISLTNPFFIAITVGGAIVTAFATNLFGFRDAINSVGVALGNAIGPLKPFLTMIGDLGKGLVNWLGQGSDATKAYADTTTTSMDQTSVAFDESGNHVKGYVSLTEGVLRNADGTVAGFTTDFNKNVGSMGQAMPGLSSAVGQAVIDSNKHFQDLIADAKVTSAALHKEFSAAFDLQGIKISGLPTGTHPPTKVGTGGPNSGLEDRGLGQGVKGFVSDLNLDVVSNGVGKLIGNFNKLVEVLKPLHLTAAQTATVWNTLTKEMGITFLKTSQNVNATDDLDKTLAKLQSTTTSTAEKNAILGQSTTLVAGTTQALEAAQSKTAGSMDKSAGSAEKLSAGQTKMQKDNEELNKSLIIYNDILNDSALMADVVAQGQTRQALAMKQGEVETLGAAAASADYTKQLASTEGQALEFSKGVLAGNDALNQSKAAAIQAAGHYAYLSNSENMAATQAAAFSQGQAEQALQLKLTEVEIAKTSGTVLQMRRDYESGEATFVAFSKGLEDQALKFEQDKVAVYNLRGAVFEMQREYDSGQATQLAYNQGLVEQQKAFEDDKLKASQLQGTIEALNEEGKSGQASTVAYNNAFYEQELAFTKSKTAADALRGTVANMQKNFTVAAVIAINNAFQDQKKKFEDDRIAAQALFGTINSLSLSLNSAEGQATNFGKGMNEAQLAFLNSIQAAQQLEGEIATLSNNMSNGDAQSLAYTKGILDQRKAMFEAYGGVSQLVGGIEELEIGMQAGLPQATAFQTALFNAAKAEDDMVIATAGLLGDIVALNNTLDNGVSSALRYNNGFATGYKSILEWANGIAKARGEASGAQSALDAVADTVGGKLPEAYSASLDAQKEFVAGMAGMPDEIQKTIDGMVTAADSFGQKLSESLSKGKKDFKDVFKGLGKEIGVEFDGEMRDAFNATEIAAAVKGQLTKGIEALKSVDIAAPGAFAKIADGLISDLQNGIAHDPRLAGVAQPIIDVLSKLKLDPTSFQLWQELEGLMSNFRSQSTIAAQTQARFTASLKDPSGKDAMVKNLAAAEQALANYQKAIASTQKSVQDYQQILGHMWDNALGPNGKSGMEEWGDKLKGIDLSGNDLLNKGGGAGGGDPFAAQKTAVEQFKTLLATIPSAVQTAVTGANTAIAGLFSNFDATVGPILLKFGTIIQALPTQIGTMVTGSNTAVAALFNNFDATVGPILLKFGTIIQELPNQVGTMVTNSNNALVPMFGQLDATVGPILIKFVQILQGLPAEVNTMVELSNKNLEPLFSPLDATIGPILLKYLQVLQGLPGEVDTMVSDSNKSMEGLGATLTSTVFPKLETDAANTFMAISNMAASESKKIGPPYAAAAGAIDTGLKRSQQLAANTFAAITNMAKSEAGKVGPPYTAAAGAIDSGLKRSQNGAASTFAAISNMARSESGRIGPLFTNAGNAISTAMANAANRAKSSMSSISSSANSANSSVRSLASSINSLKSRTITITTVYVTRHVTAAKGFGPAIVSNATNFTAGESGPELVSVIPLSSGGIGTSGSTNNTQQLSTMINKNSSIQNTGVSNLIAGNNTSSSTSTNSSSVQNSVINRFNESVDKITTAFNRQESIMTTATNNTMIQNANTVGGSNTNITRGGGITNTITNNNAGIPNISTVRGGGGTSISRGGGDLESLVGVIKDMVLSAFAQTTINLNNTTTIDSNKVYEAQKKQFGLRNGAMFK